MSQTEIACALAGAAALGTMYLVTKPSRHAPAQAGGGTCASAMRTVEGEVSGQAAGAAAGAAQVPWDQGQVLYAAPESTKPSPIDGATRRRLAVDRSYNDALHESLGTRTIGHTIIRPGMCDPSVDPAVKAIDCRKLKDVMLFNVPCDHLSPVVAQN